MSKYLLLKDQIQTIAELSNMSYDEAKQMLNALSYEEMAEKSKNQNIIDRINSRLRGEFVTPAWVEGLRGH